MDRVDMGIFQQVFDNTLEEQLSHEKLAANVIAFKLEKAGIRLSKSVRVDLEKQILKLIDDSTYKVSIDDKKLRRLNPHLPKDYNFKPVLNLTSRDMDAYGRKARRRMEEAIPKMVEASALHLYKSVRKDRELTLAIVEVHRRNLKNISADSGTFLSRL